MMKIIVVFTVIAIFTVSNAVKGEICDDGDTDLLDIRGVNSTQPLKLKQPSMKILSHCPTPVVFHSFANLLSAYLNIFRRPTWRLRKVNIVSIVLHWSPNPEGCVLQDSCSDKLEISFNFSTRLSPSIIPKMGNYENLMKGSDMLNESSYHTARASSEIVQEGEIIDVWT